MKNLFEYHEVSYPDTDKLREVEDLKRRYTLTEVASTESAAQQGSLRLLKSLTGASFKKTEGIDVFIKNGDISTVIHLLQSAAATEDDIAPDSLALAKTYCVLGALLGNQGRNLKQATSLLKEAIGIQEKEQHFSRYVQEQLAASRACLAQILCDQGYLEEASAEYKKAIEAHRMIDPASDSIPRLRSSLASVLREQGFLSDSLEIHESLKSTDATDRNYEIVQSNLAAALEEQGKLSEAFAINKELVSIRETNNPGTLILAVSYNNTGTVLSTQGSLTEALEYHNKAKEIREKLCPHTMNLAVTYISISTIFGEQEKLDEALEYAKKTGDIVLYLAPFSTPASVVLNSLATIHSMKAAASPVDSDENHKRAVQYYKKSLEIQNRFSEASLGVATTYTNIADMHINRGKNLNEAYDYVEKAIAIRERLAPKSVDLGMSKISLAMVAKSKNGLKEAIELFRNAAKMSGDPDLGLVKNHWVFVNSRYWEAQLLFDLGKYQDAYKKACELAETAPNHKGGHMLKARYCETQGRFEEAIIHHDRTLGIDPDFADIVVGKGDCVSHFLKSKREQGENEEDPMHEDNNEAWAHILKDQYYVNQTTNDESRVLWKPTN